MSKKSRGFTLVELMVTLAVATILLTVGVPSLVSVYEQVRVDNNIEKIQNLMAFARNQAISYGTTVNVCPFASATSCGSTTNWSGGVRVFITDAGGSDNELRAIDAFNNNDKIKGPAGIVTFSSEGLSSGGNIIYCPGGKATDSQSINISSSGLVSYGTTGNAC